MSSTGSDAGRNGLAEALAVGAWGGEGRSGVCGADDTRIAPKFIVQNKKNHVSQRVPGKALIDTTQNLFSARQGGGTLKPSENGRSQKKVDFIFRLIFQS